MQLYSREALKSNYPNLIDQFDEQIRHISTDMVPVDKEARKEVKHLVDVLRSKKVELNELYQDLQDPAKRWRDFYRCANFMYMRAQWQLESVSRKLAN